MTEDSVTCEDKSFKSVSDAIKNIAVKLGAKLETEQANAQFRGYTKERGYLAFIRQDQAGSGEFTGLSFVVFPINIDEVNGEYTCVVSIGIGRGDLGDDEELARLPYFRRAYLKLDGSTIPNCKGKFFIKTSFADNETKSEDLFKALHELPNVEVSNLKTIHGYEKELPANVIVDFNIDNVKSLYDEISKTRISEKGSNGFDLLVGWLAQYAKIRGWDFRKQGVYDRQDALINRVSSNISRTNKETNDEVLQLLEKAHYVVLQGAPGTGKTRMAKELSKDFGKVFFTQFHAETTFTEFVGGIRPKLCTNKKALRFEYKEGKLTEAIKWALNNTQQKCILIIDEINRANLSNVLGPVFYLFERPHTHSKDTDTYVAIDIETSDGKVIELPKLPDNLYVVATMNTSDRSLANIDYALRRRFAWYTLYPVNLKNELKDSFYDKLYTKVAEIFEKYASDEELSLQPGHSYFIAGDDQEMKWRLTYEIMPLMKEYFNNGLMLQGRDEFATLYYNETGQFMYK